jgi:hypothetical protein
MSSNDDQNRPRPTLNRPRLRHRFVPISFITHMNDFITNMNDTNNPVIENVEMGIEQSIENMDNSGEINNIFVINNITDSSLDDEPALVNTVPLTREHITERTRMERIQEEIQSLKLEMQRETGNVLLPVCLHSIVNKILYEVEDKMPTNIKSDIYDKNDFEDEDKIKKYSKLDDFFDWLWNIMKNIDVGELNGYKLFYMLYKYNNNNNIREISLNKRDKYILECCTNILVSLDK